MLLLLFDFRVRRLSLHLQFLGSWYINSQHLSSWAHLLCALYGLSLQNYIPSASARALFLYYYLSSYSTGNSLKLDFVHKVYEVYASFWWVILPSISLGTYNFSSFSFTKIAALQNLWPYEQGCVPSHMGLRFYLLSAMPAPAPAPPPPPQPFLGPESHAAPLTLLAWMSLRDGTEASSSFFWTWWCTESLSFVHFSPGISAHVEKSPRVSFIYLAASVWTPWIIYVSLWPSY